MRSRKNRHRGGTVPPFVDPAFAEALAGSRDRSSRRDKPDHKTPMLCRQVQRVLSLLLSGEAGDDALRDISIADVLPAPNASRLLVRIVVPPDMSVIDVLERLDRIAPRLRAEVARSITRKRAPELTFMPVPGGEVTP